MKMATRRGAEVALAWHTAALVGVILAVSLTGTVLMRHPSTAPPFLAHGGSRIGATYLPMILVQWGLVLYVCRIGRVHNAIASLLGERWSHGGRVLVDVALAIAAWCLIEASEVALVTLFGVHASPSTDALLPRTLVERAVWVFVAMSAGFGEEVVYRGYLQMQLIAFTRRACVGVVLQAVFFGIAHADQGVSGVARMALYGLGLGVLARWRRGLLPGIVCHVGIDLASGLLHG